MFKLARKASEPFICAMNYDFMPGAPTTATDPTSVVQPQMSAWSHVESLVEGFLSR